MIGSRQRSAVSIAVVLACALARTPARAETDEERAVALFEEGRKLAREGRCAEAITPLLESVRHAEGVGALLNIGHCYELLGKTASAYRWISKAREVATTRGDRRRDEAAARARVLEKDLSTLVVHLPPSLAHSAEVRVDGDPWPRERLDTPTPIDPGAHEIEVLAPPHPRQSETVTIGARAHRLEWTAKPPVAATQAPALALAPVPPPDGRGAPSSPQRTLGLVTGGAGLAGLAAGAIFGVVSLTAHSSLVGRCPTYPTCSSALRDELDEMNGTARTTGTLSTVSIVAGAALLVGGAALFLSAPTAPRARR